MIALNINFKKIKYYFLKIPGLLAENAFLTFLGLFLIVLVISSILFYKYDILIKKTVIKTDDQPIEFKEQIHSSVIQIWQEREKKLEQADSKIYLNPFR